MSFTSFLEDNKDLIKKSNKVRIISIDPAVKTFAVVSCIVEREMLETCTNISQLVDSENFDIEKGNVFELKIENEFIEPARNPSIQKQILLVLNMIMEQRDTKVDLNIFLIEEQPAKNKTTTVIELGLTSMIYALNSVSPKTSMIVHNITAASKNNFMLYENISNETTYEKKYRDNKRRSVLYLKEFFKRKNKDLPKLKKLDDVADCFLYCCLFIDSMRYIFAQD